MSELHYGRRAVLGGVLSVGLAGIARAANAQDILDPSVLTKQQSARDRLLDPSNAVADHSLNDSAAARPSNHYDPGYARSMNGSVMGALISVLHACAACSNTAQSCIAECNALSDSLGAARRDKWSKLEEYRSGLFCSGCGQTKSEILAKGEQFPHSGQHIIAATPQQIAAKELELDKHINDVSQRLDKANQRQKDADDAASEALDQLAYGLQLWRLTVGFEQRLIQQVAQDICLPAQAEYAKASDQLSQIKTVAPLQPTPDQFARLESDLRLWTNIQLAAVTRAQQAVRSCRQALDAATASARRARDALIESGSNVIPSMTDPVRATQVQNQMLSVSGNAYLMCPSPSASHMNLFRMGDVSVARRGTELSQVRDFISRFEQTAGYFNAIQAPIVSGDPRADMDQWLSGRRPKAVPTA